MGMALSNAYADLRYRAWSVECARSNVIAKSLAEDVSRLVHRDVHTDRLALLPGLSASDRLHQRQGVEATIEVRLTCLFMSLPQLSVNAIRQTH
jgi:hypothetical protein